MKAFLFSFLLFVLLTGCVNQEMVVTPGYVGPNQVPISRMAAHMQYRGFAILKPNDTRWYNIFGEQSPYETIFRIPRLSSTHTFFASVRNLRISITPRSDDEFKAYVDSNVTTFGSGYELISYESQITRIQGQLAIRYKLVVWNKVAQGTEEPLVMTTIGFEVIHPSWPRTVIASTYSERGRKDEITGDLDKVGEDFLAHVVLESSPGVKING